MLQIVSLVVVALLTALDQLIKYFIVEKLKGTAGKLLVPGVLQLSYVENDGAMMGLFGGKASIMTVLTVIILVVLLAALLLKKVKPGFVYGCLVAIVAGGVGNLIDRVRLGYVIDYIEVLFVDFYVFNFADCLVTVGAFLIIGYEIYEIVKETKSSKKSREEQNG